VCRENLPPNVRVGYGYGYPRLQGPNLRDPSRQTSETTCHPLYRLWSYLQSYPGLNHPSTRLGYSVSPSFGKLSRKSFLLLRSASLRASLRRAEGALSFGYPALTSQRVRKRPPWLDVAGLLSFAPGGAGASLVRVSRHRFSFPWVGGRPMRHSGQALRGLDQFNASRSRFPYFGKFHRYSTSFQIATLPKPEGLCFSPKAAASVSHKTLCGGFNAKGEIDEEDHRSDSIRHSVSATLRFDSNRRRHHTAPAHLSTRHSL
jgi:hypothetical protein